MEKQSKYKIGDRLCLKNKKEMFLINPDKVYTVKEIYYSDINTGNNEISMGGIKYREEVINKKMKLI